MNDGGVLAKGLRSDSFGLRDRQKWDAGRSSDIHDRLFG
jgi:hypothetical protein